MNTTPSPVAADEAEQLVSSLLHTVIEPAPDTAVLLSRLRVISEWLSQAELSESGAALLYKVDGRIRTAVITPDEPLTVGRSSGCTLPFPDNARLSRRHFRLFHENDAWWLEDLHSHNGTFLDGCHDRLRLYALRDGDMLRAGGETFVFVAGTP